MCSIKMKNIIPEHEKTRLIEHRWFRYVSIGSATKIDRHINSLSRYRRWRYHTINDSCSCNNQTFIRYLQLFTQPLQDRLRVLFLLRSITLSGFIVRVSKNNEYFSRSAISGALLTRKNIRYKRSFLSFL